MTQITPSLLAAAYASITVPSAPRSADLSVIGLAAADIPPVTVADGAFGDNSLGTVGTLGSTIAGAASLAAAAVGAASPSSFFSTGGGTAAAVLGLILDTSA